MAVKEYYHYVHEDVYSTIHKLPIEVVGCGGTGSHVLSGLAMISQSLKRIGRPPLYVRAYDPDIVEDHNIGRQTFSSIDIGKNKASVLISRINRFYGTNWDAIEHKFGENVFEGRYSSNFSLGSIVIGCVDTISSRRAIERIVDSREDIYDSFPTPRYYMDIGNGDRYGQVILATTANVKQPRTIRIKNRISNLPKVLDELNIDENMIEPGGPSCSAMDALTKQDLFINKILATFAVNMIWEMATKFRIDYRGIYLNLDTMKISKIKLKPIVNEKQAEKIEV